MGMIPTVTTDNETGDMNGRTFKVFGQLVGIRDGRVGDAVIPNQGIGQDQYLSTITGIRQGFGITDHTGIEDDFPVNDRVGRVSGRQWDATKGPTFNLDHFGTIFPATFFQIQYRRFTLVCVSVCVCGLRWRTRQKNKTGAVVSDCNRSNFIHDHDSRISNNHIDTTTNDIITCTSKQSNTAALLLLFVVVASPPFVISFVVAVIEDNTFDFVVGLIGIILILPPTFLLLGKSNECRANALIWCTEETTAICGSNSRSISDSNS